MRNGLILLGLVGFAIGCGEGTASESDGENPNNSVVVAQFLSQGTCAYVWRHGFQSCSDDSECTEPGYNHVETCQPEGTAGYCKIPWLYAGSSLNICTEDSDCSYYGHPWGEECLIPDCGNGTLEPTEECDDGNGTDGDGCDDAPGSACAYSPCDADFVTPNSTGGFDVTPANDPGLDVYNVQCALYRSVQGSTVLLEAGIFDFGTDGVVISTPDLTLKGETDENTGELLSTITGGYALQTGFFYTIYVNASGINVLDLDLSDVFTGILIGFSQEGKPIHIEGNNFRSDLDWGWGRVYAFNNLAPLEVVHNTFTLGGPYPFGVETDRNRGTIDITHNTFDHEGLGVALAIRGAESRPTSGGYFDNPPVTIYRNSMSGEASTFLQIGDSARYLNNALIAENAFAGTAYFGIWKAPYGYNNTFIDNDLSELTTYINQFAIDGGADSTYVGNVFGPTYGAAVEIWGVNYHPNMALPTPNAPAIQGNVFMNNDYRNTGCVPLDAGGSPCIWIHSQLDEHVNVCEVEEGETEGICSYDWSACSSDTPCQDYGSQITGNFIRESGRFPEGTGGIRKHISYSVTENVHDNTIVGLPY